MRAGSALAHLMLLSTTASVARALRVTIIRHGQTEWNAAGRLQGASDSPLTELGVQQAHACGARLRGRKRFDALYCSPLLRARRTAELIYSELETGQCPPLKEDVRLEGERVGRGEPDEQNATSERHSRKRTADDALATDRDVVP